MHLEQLFFRVYVLHDLHFFRFIVLLKERHLKTLLLLLSSKMRGRLILFGIFIIFLSVNVFATLNVTLSDQGTGVRAKSDNSLLSSGNLRIEFWDALSEGSIIYNETFTGAISSGSWDVALGENNSNPLQLEYGKAYYKDYFINGESANFTNITGGTVDRQLFYSPLGDIADEDINDNINLTLGQKITFALGEFIDNIADGWIQVTGGLNVSKNIRVGNLIINNLNAPENVSATLLAGGSLDASTNYYYHVIAFDSNYMYSEPSLPVICTTTSSSKTCRITWNSVDGASTYRVYRGTIIKMNGTDTSSSNNSTVMTDTNRNFGTYRLDYGVVLSGDYIINVNDFNSCKIAGNSTNTIICSAGGMDWDSGDVYHIIEARHKAEINSSAISPYSDTGNSLSVSSTPISKFSLYTPGNICIGERCITDPYSGASEDFYPKFEIRATQIDTQGATMLIRSGFPKESLSTLSHRTSILAHSEDSGSSTGSMAAAVFLAERNGEVSQMSWNTGVFASYNQRNGTFTSLGFPASGVLANTGSRSNQRVNIGGMGVAGIVTRVVNANPNSTINKAYGIYIPNAQNTGNITNLHGIMIQDQIAGDTNNLGIWINGSDDGSLLNSGASLVFGSNKDVKIFFNSSDDLVLSSNNKTTINNMLRLLPQSSISNCNSNTEGGIVYNITSKSFFGCNSTNWVQLNN